jgi:hypothetical protein
MENLAMKSRSHFRGARVAAMLLALAVGREALAQGTDRTAIAGKDNARVTFPRETSAKPKLSDEVAAFFQEAFNAGRTGDWSRAAGLDFEVEKKSPDLVPARLHQGAMLILNDHEAEGRELIDQALGRNPDPQLLTFLIQTLENGAEVSRQRKSPLVQTYSKLAFERAEALGYATSANATMLSLIAKLALEMRDNNTFRMATASLVRDHQAEMKTHYFDAIRAVKDRDWMTAEDEIRRAGDLGLLRNVVDQVLA